MERCANILMQWTGKTSAKIIYDSTVDEFTDDGLFNKIQGKPNIALVGFTTDGDVFGGFYSRAVTKHDKGFYDPNIFAFSFESHGRCMTPQRFLVRNGMKDCACLFPPQRQQWVCRVRGGWCWWVLPRERGVRLVLYGTCRRGLRESRTRR